MKLVLLLICYIAIAIIVVGCSGGVDQDVAPAPAVLFPPEQLPSDVDANACNRVFYIRPGFTDEQKAQIRNAVARWNEIAIVQTCVQESADSIGHEVRVVVFDSDEYHTLALAYGGGIWGECHKEGSHIVVLLLDNIYAEWFESVAVHEFGHALGLQHVPPPAIMSSGVSSQEFTSADYSECRLVGACKTSLH